MAWVRAQLCKLQKGWIWLAAASDKVYQLLAHGRWFSPGIPASSTTKTGRHDIAEILLKVALNTNFCLEIKKINLSKFMYSWRTVVHTNVKILELFLDIYFFPTTEFDVCNLSSSGDVIYYKERWWHWHKLVTVSVSGTCRIPKRLLYTVRESAGFMGCIPAGRSWMPLRNLHTRLCLAVDSSGRLFPRRMNA